MATGLLSLFKHTDYAPYVHTAIDVATALLNLAAAAPHHQSTTFPPEICERLYNDVDIEFRSCSREGLYGWTHSVAASTIFVNAVMRDRLELLTQQGRENTHEFRCILLMVALVLVHGSWNLLWRWSHPRASTSKPVPYDIVRKDVDTAIFQGQCRLLIRKPTGSLAHEWTSDMPVVHFVIQQLYRDKVIGVQQLRRLLDPTQIANKPELPKMTLKVLQKRGSSVHLDVRPLRKYTPPPRKITRKKPKNRGW